MRRLLRRLGPAWRVHRRRHPQSSARVEASALALRGGLAQEVTTLRSRLAELQRDHLLLAAHVAMLTERVAEAPLAATASALEDEAARQRARLAAVAFYEERIGRLEERAGGRGHARRSDRSASDSRIPGEQPKTAR